MPVDDSAFQAGLGCYTTARWTGGRVRYGARAALRLARDAAALALGAVDPGVALAALEALGRASFGESEGVVRLQASASEAGVLRLTGTTRALGPEPAAWSALVAPHPHGGPSPWQGAKLSGHPRIALARAAARAGGCDEALMLDGGGRLVEGARTSLAVVTADGDLFTPPLARGGVRSVAREVVEQAFGPLVERDLALADLEHAREVVALNAVRGARAIVSIGGRPVGDGAPGAAAARLQELLDAAE